MDSLLYIQLPRLPYGVSLDDYAYFLCGQVDRYIASRRSGFPESLPTIMETNAEIMYLHILQPRLATIVRYYQALRETTPYPGVIPQQIYLRLLMIEELIRRIERIYETMF